MNRSTLEKTRTVGDLVTYANFGGAEFVLEWRGVNFYPSLLTSSLQHRRNYRASV